MASHSNSASESEESDGVEISCRRRFALLYRSKFGSGKNSNSRCILLKDKLYSPPEFLSQCKVSRQKDWKKVLSFRESSLHTLMKDGRLPVHSSRCSCAWCSQNVLKRRRGTNLTRQRKQRNHSDDTDESDGSDEVYIENVNDSDYEFGDDYKYVASKQFGTPSKKSKIKLRSKRAPVPLIEESSDSSSEDVSDNNERDERLVGHSTAAQSINCMSLKISRIQNEDIQSTRQDDATNREENDGRNSDYSNSSTLPECIDCRSPDSTEGNDAVESPSLLRCFTADSLPDTHLEASNATDGEEDEKPDERTEVCVKARGGEEININWQTLFVCPRLKSKVRHGGIRDEINLMGYSVNVIQMLLQFINGEEFDCTTLSESDMCALIELGFECLDEETTNDLNTKALIKQILTEDNVVSTYSTAFTEKFQKALEVCKRFADGCDLQVLATSSGFRKVVPLAVSYLFRRDISS